MKVVFNKTYELLLCSEAALVTSGTATLETALMNVPEVVCYKGSLLSYFVAKQVIHVNFISLVNLIMSKEIVKELIQKNLTADNLTTELEKILNHQEVREKMKSSYRELREKLGGAGASSKTAELILTYLKEKK